MSETVYFLQSLPFFQGLEQSDIQNLLAASKVKAYPKRSSIFAHGDRADRFFVIMSGWIKLYKTTMEGNESVLALFTRADSFGEAILIEGASYPHNAETVEDAKVIELPASVIKNIVTKKPELALHMMQSMTRHIQRLQLENEHLAVMNTTQRVGCFLLQLCLGKITSDGYVEFPYDKHLAATRMGMKAETFSRAIKDLQKIGVFVKNDDIFIRNMEELKALCCANCSSSPDHCLPVHYNSQN